MNDEAVYRTAPATPGLLNIYMYYLCHLNQLFNFLGDGATLVSVQNTVRLIFGGA